MCDESVLLFGIADGVGGLPGGSEAAQLTVDQIATAIHGAVDNPELDLVAIVHQTNEAVSLLGHQISPGMGIGTTLTFGCIRGNLLNLAHVGDSRAYGLRSGDCSRITEDHSVENEARLRRAKGEVIYYHEANRNALTRCIGQPTPPEVDLIAIQLAPGDRYLFCTDGVTRMVTDGELATLMSRFDEPAELLKEVIGLAVRRGGPDNATGVAVYIDQI